jgi:alpha-mannosidase
MRFTLDKLTARTAELGRLVYSKRLSLDEWRVRRGPVEGGSTPGLDDASWDVARVGAGFTGARASFWFRRRVTVPEDFAGKPAALYLKLLDQHTLAGAEGQVYVDGEIRQGIDRNHQEVLLAESAEAGRTYSVTIDGFVGMRDQTLVLQEATLVAIDREAEDCYYNMLVGLQVVQTLPENSYDRALILNALDESEQMIDWRVSGSPEFYASVRLANSALRERLYSQATNHDREKVTLVGHSHIDVAWLWTLAVTRQKCGRTFSTVLRLMEQYPDYHFTQSQPQLYAYTKRDYPELYAQIKTRVAEGRWEATGGMWLEADCNLTGAESLVRQFLYGRRFFRDEFGRDCDTLWLPDVFGYSWALPQLIKAAGMKYFMTTKISWSQYNQPVNDTFYWQGIDGTKVLTHFITTPSETNWFKTYNGDVTPKSVQGTWDSYHQKDINDEVLLSFGYGDGGGGPTKEMLETARRLQDFPGAPKVTMGTADDYFRRLEGRLDGKRVPVWNGELYLEYHRGTYTTQGRNKRANRKSEVLYHAAELFGGLAGLLGEPCPRETLADGWRLILLNQFHDIIPGSSIGEVYEDSQEQYKEVRAYGEKALDDALRAIASRIDLSGPDLAFVVFNPAPFDRTDIVSAKLPDGWSSCVILDTSGSAVPSQIRNGADGAEVLFEAVLVPACGYATYRFRAGDQPSGTIASPGVTVNGLIVENAGHRATFDERGLLIGLRDKLADREVLPAGAVANLFQTFEDKSMRFDAWDIDLFYQDKMTPLLEAAEVSVIETGPVRATIQLTRHFSRSTIRQLVRFYAQTPRIDFVTEVDWHEKHTLLKVAFPVDIRATEATYEIQFGSVQRPTHWNTSWDWARFETCAQKWVDLSEGDYGVSLLNDCKYGHDIKDNTIRLSLLKSPTSPDPHADEGHHEFTYSLLPHNGSWRDGTVSEAYGLNNPFTVLQQAPHSGTLPASLSLVRSSRPNVVIETVKQAEDDDSLVIRVYEAYNQRGQASLTFARPIDFAEEVNLLEEPLQRVAFSGTDLTFTITPYQIRSFKVRLGGQTE